MQRLCFVGTCQAMALQEICDRILLADDDPPTTYVSTNAPLDAAGFKALCEADVIIRQTFSSEQALTFEPDDFRARTIAFPYISGLFLWPYASQPHIRQRFVESIGSAPYDEELGDAWLNRLIAADVDPEECADRYRELDILKAASVGRRAEIIADQQAKRDAATGIPALEFIRANLAGAELFLTRGHLGRPTLLFLCREVFGRLGLGDEHIRRIDRQMPKVMGHRNYAAIHPAIGEFFGLSYAADGRLYDQFEGRYRFRECVARYARYEFNETAIQGILSESRGRFPEALEILEPELRAIQSMPYALYAYGRALSETGRAAEAEEAIAHAARLEPADPHLAIELGKLYHRVGRTDDAARTLRGVAARFPDFPPALDTLSHVLAASRPEEAAEAAGRVVELCARTRPYLAHLGRLLLRTGRLADGCRAFERAVVFDPPNIQLRRALIDAYLAAAEPLKALAAIEDLVALVPDSPGPLWLWAQVLKSENLTREAIAIFERLIALAPSDARAHEELSHQFVRAKDLSAAIEAARAALRLDPEKVDLLKHLARMHEARSEWRMALGCCSLIATIAPEDAGVHAKVGELHERLGEIEAALQAASAAARLDATRDAQAARLKEIVARQLAGVAVPA